MMAEYAAHEWKELIETKHWQMLKEEINERIETLREALTTEKLHNNMIHIQGEIYSLREVLDLPDSIITNAENDLTLENENE